ncbi:sugar phosphate isomerase/epimerase family protein [Subtercola sp. YIM 133946]|uniref:sugar phosphate isomerase/epimerase family protein n=1 Tax=Subtercola sp. YIM 133946 TaxID=3118909 RepID=UPI002F958E22
MSHDIKTGASLYSFQEEYFLRKLGLEEIVATAGRIGALGIETLAEQMMPGFPALSDEFYADWHRWMKKYGTTPTAHDMFLDTKRFKDRLLTHDEMVESVQRDIIHAEKLGAQIIRVIVNTPPEVIEASAPFAREYGVVLAVEVHAPWSFEHPWIQEHIAVADRAGLDAVGIIPDMGIFTRKLPRVVWNRSLRDGATPALVEQIVSAYDSKADLTGLEESIAAQGGNGVDGGLAWQATHTIDLDPSELITWAKYIVHIHGKFYEMTDEGVEYSIPYDEIVRALKTAGYTGYISSEYEGNRHIQDVFPVDSVEQVSRQQQMLRRLIDSE